MSPKPKVLLFDAGLNIGDNCRAFVLFKAFSLAHPELETVCWLSPQVEAKLGPLLRASAAVSRIVVAPRSPRWTYAFNHHLIKHLISRCRPWHWSACPPGEGPGAERFDHLVPTGEPWLSAKLMSGQKLDEPEEVNQGDFLSRLLDLRSEQAVAALPLFGSLAEPEEGLTLGLCRPEPSDPKQLPDKRRARVWEAALCTGRRITAVDLQDWAPPPALPRVEDLRSLSLAEKIGIFNRAELHVGLDGGLVHFAAACGCPTLAFYAGPGDDPGRVFGPWPRATPRGGHVYCNDFHQFIERIEGISEKG